MAPPAQMMTASPGERSHSLQDRTALFVHYHTETVTIFTEIQISSYILCLQNSLES